MSLFEHFVAEGSEKADELAKDEAMLDRGEMAQIRVSTFQVRREEVCAAFAVRSQFSLLGWRCCWIVKNLSRRRRKVCLCDRKVEAKKHRTEWCATTTRDCCMRCGRSSKKVKLPGK